MPEPIEEFRQRLLDVQEISPTLREAYKRELHSMLHPPMTVRSAFPGTVLLVLLIGCIVLLARAILFYHVSPLMRAGHVALAAGFIGAAFFIARDLYKRRHTPGGSSSVAQILTLAAGIITVVALILGLRAPSDPKSLFGAFYVFVFYFACAIWSIERRIASTELAAREQSLRIECRLADLAERLGR